MQGYSNTVSEISKQNMLSHVHHQSDLEDSSSQEFKSNSLHDCEKLGQSVQTRVMLGTVQQGTDEDQLSPGLSLFMKNMKHVDIARS